MILMTVGFGHDVGWQGSEKKDRHRILPSEMAVIRAVSSAEFESVPFFACCDSGVEQKPGGIAL
jgi:hypothetical protein